MNNENEMTEVTLSDLENVDGGFAWVPFLAGIAVCMAFDIDIKISVAGHTLELAC